MPDGEIFTGPVEDSMEGTVSFSFPAFYSGREADGVKLTFKKGRVVKATASKNEENSVRSSRPRSRTASSAVRSSPS